MQVKSHFFETKKHIIEKKISTDTN